MAEKASYPPVYIEPGTTTQLTATNGTVEFIGVDDPKILDFIEAVAELRMLRNSSLQPSNASVDAAKRKVDRMWGHLPMRVFNAIERRRADGPVIL